MGDIIKAEQDMAKEVGLEFDDEGNKVEKSDEEKEVEVNAEEEKQKETDAAEAKKKEDENKSDEEKEAEAEAKKKADDEVKKENEVKPDIDDELRNDDVERNQKFTEKFNPNEKALFFKGKKYLKRAQHAEVEINTLKDKYTILQKELELARTKREEKKEEKIEPELDEFGNEKPLTRAEMLKVLKDLKEETENKNKEVSSEVKQQQDRALAVDRALTEQDLDARAKYEDYDDVMKMTNDLMANSDKIFADDPVMRSKMERKKSEWLRMANEAPENTGEYKAADLAYEIGKYHPGFNKGEKKEKQNVSKKSDAEKAIENSKKKSSAELNGGDSEITSYENLTMAQLARLSPEKFAEVPEKIRDKFLKQ